MRNSRSSDKVDVATTDARSSRSIAKRKSLANTVGDRAKGTAHRAGRLSPRGKVFGMTVHPVRTRSLLHQRYDEATGKWSGSSTRSPDGGNGATRGARPDRSGGGELIAAVRSGSQSTYWGVRSQDLCPRARTTVFDEGVYM